MKVLFLLGYVLWWWEQSFFLQGLPPRATKALLDTILQADNERQHPWYLSDDETESYHLSLLYNWHVSPLYCTLCCVLANAGAVNPCVKGKTNHLHTNPYG